MKLATLTMCLGLAVAACGNLDADPPANESTVSDSEHVGMIEMALTAVPADVACVRITAKGQAREKIADVDVVPGPSMSQVLTGFPLGQVKITAEAFGNACDKVTSKATSTWVSETKDISIVEGTKTRVEFTMTRNGRVDVSFNFQEEPACSAVGVVCGTNKECCSGVCKSNACQSAPVAPWRTLFTAVNCCCCLRLALGILAGLVLARVPLPLPTGNVTLGIAGGPLIVALILGRAGRTGPFVWSMPYEATVALRELGLLLFLAGVGVGAGAALGSLPGSVGLSIVALGAVITLACSALVLSLAPKFARTSITRSLGTCSGMQTQPATLAAAYEISGRSEETYVAYAVVYPVAMIGKILIAQLLLMLSA